MERICIDLQDESQIELDDVDIGVAGGTVAFDVTGRVVGLDEETLDEMAGKRLIPTEVCFKPRDGRSMGK